MDDNQLLAQTVFTSLEAMDREATTVRDGHQTGLYWYGAHARPEQKKPQTEPNWTRRLAELLSTAGYPTRAEVAYPERPRKKCDLVVGLPDGASAWIEIKGAFKRYWLEQGSEYIYRSYLLHPLEGGLDPKTHTAAHDLEKLTWLKAAHADYVGLLLLGFDSWDRPMDPDVRDLARLASLSDEPWRRWDRSWGDPHRSDCRTRCWLWLRPTTGEPDLG